MRLSGKKAMDQGFSNPLAKVVARKACFSEWTAGSWALTSVQSALAKRIAMIKNPTRLLPKKMEEVLFTLSFPLRDNLYRPCNLLELMNINSKYDTKIKG
jgi:hypothetical protein